jgi:hypothetical protein
LCSEKEKDITFAYRSLLILAAGTGLLAAFRSLMHSPRARITLDGDVVHEKQGVVSSKCQSQES